MYKVLVVGHPLYHYLQSIADGFEELNCEVNIFTHKNTNVKKLEQKNFLNRLRHFISLRKINKDLLSKVKQFQPDLVLVINGEVLLPETVTKINQQTLSALWLVDGFDNIKLPKTTMQLFQKQFVFEPQDINFLPNAQYLPYGADPKIYYPNEKSQFLRDISFVGAGHQDRLEILNNVAIFCQQNHYSFEVFGPYNQKHKEKYPALFDAIKINGKVDPHEVADIYRTSKINLNIHHQQSKDGVNPRVFEISACKAFQLCDNKNYLSLLFGENCLATYENFHELSEQIQKSISDENKTLYYRENAYLNVNENHLFKSRCKKILDSF